MLSETTAYTPDHPFVFASAELPLHGFSSLLISPSNIVEQIAPGCTRHPAALHRATLACICPVQVTRTLLERRGVFQTRPYLYYALAGQVEDEAGVSGYATLMPNQLDPAWHWVDYGFRISFAILIIS